MFSATLVGGKFLPFMYDFFFGNQFEISSALTCQCRRVQMERKGDKNEPSWQYPLKLWPGLLAALCFDLWYLNLY